MRGLWRAMAALLLVISIAVCGACAAEVAPSPGWLIGARANQFEPPVSIELTTLLSS